MRALGSWMLSLAACGVVCTLFFSLVPLRFKPYANLIGGLLTILVALQPLSRVSDLSFAGLLRTYESALSDRLRSAEAISAAAAEEMVLANAQVLCGQALAAMGIEAAVDLGRSDGTFSSATVTYHGVPDETAKAAVREWLAQQLGIAPEKQIHR